MLWLGLTATGIGCGIAGWLAHSLSQAHSRRKQSAPIDNPITEPTLSTPPGRVSELESVAGPPPSGSRVSREADTAGKVIVHLALLGRLGNDEVGRLGFTQRGMTAALGIRQGNLTKVLSRLQAARVIEVDRRHVAGEARRVNVYRLTALGESVAREIRRRGQLAGTSGEGGSEHLG